SLISFTSPCMMFFFLFFFYWSVHLRDLHSFPTRRSSDLLYYNAWVIHFCGIHVVASCNTCEGNGCFTTVIENRIFNFKFVPSINCLCSHYFCGRANL